MIDLFEKLKEWHPLQPFHKDGEVFIGGETKLIVGVFGFDVWWINPDGSYGSKRYKENDLIPITYYKGEEIGINVGLLKPMAIWSTSSFKGLKRTA